MDNINLSIPNALLLRPIQDEDLSILIGQNGSGKSTLLNELSTRYLDRGMKVIAIANTVHDKFHGRRASFKVLRGRNGRRQTQEILKRALKIAARDMSKDRLQGASRVLRYVGLEPDIGFKIVNLDRNKLEKLKDTLDSSKSPYPRYSNLVEDLLYRRGISNTIWFRTDTKDFRELQKSVLLDLFVFEAKLKKLGVIQRVEVFLKKNGKTISMLDASSGELSLITSIVYISSVITENTAILIDEPENSLHPIWQKEYARNLLDIFYLYQPKIVIATHSPLVVNGAELYSKHAVVYKSENGNFEKQGKEPLNVEELFFRFFDISTPENRFLSTRLMRILNILAEDRIPYSTFEAQINDIKSKAYAPKQIEALDAVIQLGRELVASK